MLFNVVLTRQSLSNLRHPTFRGQYYREVYLGFVFFFLLSLLALLSSTASYSAEASTLKHQENIHTRTLAASCAACHGTHGNSQSTTPVLAGLDTTYFLTQMLAFKNGRIDSTVMHRHAKGLTISEINHLADYFSQQKRVSIPAPSSQTLKARDD